MAYPRIVNTFTSYCRGLQKEKFNDRVDNNIYKHDKQYWKLFWIWQFWNFWSVILDPPSGISILSVHICNRGIQKPLSTEVHPNQVTYVLIRHIGFAIVYFWIYAWINNQRPQKPTSTEFHLKEVTFCILIRHIESVILNFWISSSDS